MNNQEGNDGFTWLRNWIGPDGNREDEAHLERQMSEDPFLADAVEGYRKFPKQDHVAALTEIRSRLRPNSSHRNAGIILLLTRVAAVALLLVVAISGFYFLGPNNAGPLSEQTESQPLDGARSTDTPQQIDGAGEQEAAALTEDQTSPTTTQTNSDTQSDVSNELIAMQEETEPKTLTKEGATPIAEIESVEAEHLRSKKKAKDANTIPTPSTADTFFSLEDSDFAKPSSPTPPNELQYVVGVVQDEIGEPISGASVVVPGTDVGTITGVDGRFSLKWDRNYSALQFNYSGFTTETRNIAGPDTLHVVLNGSDVALDAATVPVPAEKEDKRAKEKASTRENSNIIATPVGGFRKLDRYVKKNLVKPAVNIQGSVRLQFTVHPDGSLSNFKVLQSLCASCDAEAIRLMQNGPKWKIDKGEQPVIQSYTVKFE